MSSSFWLHLGFDAMLARHHLVAVLPSQTRVAQRLMTAAKIAGLLVNCTGGHAQRAIVLADTGQVFVSAIAAPTLSRRMAKAVSAEGQD